MRVRVTACVCVCLMRLLLAKTFNIVSFEKKRIKKKVCVQFVAITREERKRKERERERETLVFLIEFWCVVWFCSSSSKKRQDDERTH
jgi:hypothetical protein